MDISALLDCKINCNGQIVPGLMERWNLTLLNGVEDCCGEITSEQDGVTIVIDFVLVNQTMH